MEKSENNMNNFGFGFMTENIPIGLYKSTPDGKFTRVNIFLANMFGFDSKAELLECNISDLYYKKGEREKLIRKYKTTDKIKNHEVMLKKKDGSLFSGSITETAVRDKSGEIVFFFGVLEDITEKKKKAEELIKLATLVEQAAISIVLTDLEGNIQYVNPWFEKLTGYTEDEAKGKNPRILKSDNISYPDNYYQSMWETITKGDIWQGQFTNIKKSGEEYIEEATIFPIKSNGNAEILGFGAVKKDITKQIELEKELEQSLREMETLKEKAESASKLKSIFLANMSHDIRTPLNAIIGFSMLLKEHKLAKKLDGYVNNIIRSGNILLNLINDILDISKIEAGQMSIVQNTFFLNELIETINSVFKSQFSRKKINFRIDMSKNIPEKIYSDKSRIQQILINMLSNSLKFTLKGEVVLGIKYNNQKDLIEFSVKDSGIGIQEEDFDKIFSPFFSNRDLNYIDESSTGLGLAICSNLSKLLSGSIRVKSEFGVGSEFILELPANSSDVEEIPRLNESQFSIEEIESTYLSDKKILIVEDNPVNSELLFEALEMKGFKKIIIVKDGEEAIQTAIKELPELIIMDNKMPKLSGLEALKILRERGFEHPVIILTADTLEELQKDKISIMPESFLTKPINFEFLFKEICSLLNPGKTTTKKILKSDPFHHLRINYNISGNVRDVLIKDLKEKHDYLNKVIRENKIGKEFEKISLIAHTYKGNAGYFGLNALETLAKELDSEFKNKRSEEKITNLTISLNTLIEDIISTNS